MTTVHVFPIQRDTSFDAFYQHILTANHSSCSPLTMTCTHHSIPTLHTSQNSPTIQPIFAQLHATQLNSARPTSLKQPRKSRPGHQRVPTDIAAETSVPVPSQHPRNRPDRAGTTADQNRPQPGPQTASDARHVSNPRHLSDLGESADRLVDRSDHGRSGESTVY